MTELQPSALDDERIEHHVFNVAEDISYHYLLAAPSRKPIATVLLLHGWPDLPAGWRNQVPYLLQLGLQLVIPDMLGYGRTSAPNNLNAYSLKAMASHMAALIRNVTDEQVILGGHDWGASLAWRLTLYHPQLFKATFAFCIPFVPPERSPLSQEQLVAKEPVLQYQIQNSSGVAEQIAMKTPEHLRGYINAMFGGVTPEGEPAFDPYIGIIEDRLLSVGQSPLLSSDMLDHYVQEFSRSGLHAPMNWYRVWRINAEEELPLAESEKSLDFKIPAMIVMAGQDPALPPALAQGSEKYFSAGLRIEVISQASHWILVDSPADSNKCIGEFLATVL